MVGRGVRRIMLLGRESLEMVHVEGGTVDRGVSKRREVRPQNQTTRNKRGRTYWYKSGLDFCIYERGIACQNP